MTSGVHSRPDSRSSFRPDRPPQQQRSAKDLIRLNQLQEDERMRQWVAQEDDFVLKQAKKKAEIRVKEGRAKAVDWLAVVLRAIGDETRDNVQQGFEEIEEGDLELREPEGVFEGLGEGELDELWRDIEAYEKLEGSKGSRKNREYWRTMAIIAKDQQRQMRRIGPEGRAVGAVQSDIDRLLGPKTLEELEGLEKQIRAKLDSNEPIDTDYWGQLLDRLLVWKAKAKLKKIWLDVIEKRLEKLRKEQALEAERARRELAAQIGDRSVNAIAYDQNFDPDPLLQIPTKDKNLEIINETVFLDTLAADRQKIIRQGYIPAPKSKLSTLLSTTSLAAPSIKPTNIKSDSTTTAFDKLVARGVDEDEEVFNAEEPSSSLPHHQKTHLRPAQTPLLQPRPTWLRLEQIQPNALRRRQPASPASFKATNFTSSTPTSPTPPRPPPTRFYARTAVVKASRSLPPAKKTCA